jgi:hypothetical protein
VLALALVIAAAAPIPEGEWLAYDFEEKRVLTLRVDSAGVYGLGFKLDAREVTLAPKVHEDHVELTGVVDAGDASVRWFPSKGGAWIWLEGRAWRARRADRPKGFDALKLFPFGDADPALLEGEPWVVQADHGYELLTRSRTRGKYATLATLTPAGSAWIVSIEGRPTGVLAEGRPAWLTSLSVAAQARCRETQWQAKTALKAAYASLRALRAELGRYPSGLRDPPRPEVPYALRVVRADAEGFLVEAVGSRAPVTGDRWTIDERGDLANAKDACGGR